MKREQAEQLVKAALKAIHADTSAKFMEDAQSAMDKLDKLNLQQTLLDLSHRAQALKLVKVSKYFLDIATLLPNKTNQLQQKVREEESGDVEKYIDQLLKKAA
jgi:ABC-type proline/glycine betaine transport system ATPase subunit